MKKMKILKILSSLVLVLALNYNSFAINDVAKDKNKGVNEVNVKKEDKNKNKKIKEKKDKNNDKKDEKNKKDEKKHEEDKNKKEEEKKKKEEEKNIKEHDKLEKAQIKKNKAKFKNFKKSDFEKDGFTLKIVRKAEVPLFHYIHNKTKAHVVFIPVEKKDIDGLLLTDRIFFKKFCDDDRGLAHFSEHYLAKFMRPFFEKYGNAECNCVTSKIGLSMLCSSRMLENDLLFKKFYESLSDSDLFENEEVFKVEKKRIIDEIGLTEQDAGYCDSKINIFYDFAGNKEYIKKVGFKDVKKFYERYIHPSNMCITKHIVFDKNKIFEFLNNLETMYLKKFDFKKTKTKLEYTNRKRFMKVDVPEKYKILAGNEKKKNGMFNYFAEVLYDLEDFNIDLDKEESLKSSFPKEGSVYKKINKFVKSLGYDFWFYTIVDEPETGKKFLNLNLKSDDGNLFKEKVLKNNLKKILEKIKEELKNVPENEIQDLKDVCDHQKYSAKDQKDDAVHFSKPYSYDVKFPLSKLTSVSFAKYGDPFSPKIFYMNKDNEIIDSKENILEKTKNNFDVFDILNKKGPRFITVFRGDENTKEKENSDYKRMILPVKFKDFKGNKMAYLMASGFVSRKLGYLLSFEKGFCYRHEVEGRIYAGDYLGAILVNKNNKDAIVEYLKKNFGDFIKNLKYKRSYFDKKIKENKEFINGKEYEQWLKEEKGTLKTIEDLIKEVEYFCETGKTHNDKLFSKDSLTQDVVDVQLLYDLEDGIGDNLVYDNYEEYEKILGSRFKNIISFISNVYKQKGVKITKQFMKEYKKYFLSYLYDLSKHRVKSIKERKKLINMVKYEDVLDTIKSAYFCYDEKYKKDVKLYDERTEYAEKVLKK